MPTQDGDFVTAEGLVKTLEEVGGGGSSPLDAWPVNSLMVLPRMYEPSQVGMPGRWSYYGLIPLQSRPDSSVTYYAAAYLREQ